MHGGTQTTRYTRHHAGPFTRVYQSFPQHPGLCADPPASECTRPARPRYADRAAASRHFLSSPPVTPLAGVTSVKVRANLGTVGFPAYHILPVCGWYFLKPVQHCPRISTLKL